MTSNNLSFICRQRTDCGYWAFCPELLTKPPHILADCWQNLQGAVYDTLGSQGVLSTADGSCIFKGQRFECSLHWLTLYTLPPNHSPTLCGDFVNSWSPYYQQPTTTNNHQNYNKQPTINNKKIQQPTTWPTTTTTIQQSNNKQTTTNNQQSTTKKFNNQQLYPPTTTTTIQQSNSKQPTTIIHSLTLFTLTPN